ncbi:MAG: sulfite exporter TauE/SafE family protein [Lachnospiraceae bacterium]|nr:sulfite exporter TauE/SafE family protein [Lachnospiraceae bacterium]
MEQVISAIAGIASGIIGAMGMGGGGVLIIYLNLFTDTPQSTAQGINLLFFLPTAVLSVLYYSRKKLIEWKIAIPFALMGMLGTLLGCFLCGRFDNTILQKMFGVLLLIMGAIGIFHKDKKVSSSK